MNIFSKSHLGIFQLSTLRLQMAGRIARLSRATSLELRFCKHPEAPQCVVVPPRSLAAHTPPRTQSARSSKEFHQVSGSRPNDSAVCLRMSSSLPMKNSKRETPRIRTSRYSPRSPYAPQSASPEAGNSVTFLAVVERQRRRTGQSH